MRQRIAQPGETDVEVVKIFARPVPKRLLAMGDVRRKHLREQFVTGRREPQHFTAAILRIRKSFDQAASLKPRDHAGQRSLRDQRAFAEFAKIQAFEVAQRRDDVCLLYTSPSPRDRTRSRMPSSA